MASRIICIYVVELCRPGCNLDTFLEWFKQRNREERGELPPSPLRPEPLAREFIRTWKGERDERDWDRLVIFKKRDGWGEVSKRREFVTVDDGELLDRATI